MTFNISYTNRCHWSNTFGYCYTLWCHQQHHYLSFRTFLSFYNAIAFFFLFLDSDSAPSNVATGNSHNVLNTNEHKAGSNKKSGDNQKEGKSDNPEKKDEEVKKKITRKEKSVLQSKLTRLAIQIGYAGK